MRLIIFILFSLISGVFCVTTVFTKADLLAVIRQDLRRNNDDYLESTISEQAFGSSKPFSTSQVSPVKILKTNKSFKTTKKTLSQFRRTFQSPEILAIDDNDDNLEPLLNKIDPSPYLMTMPTRVTKTFKTNEVSRKNDLEQYEKKTFNQKTFPSTKEEKAKGSKSDEELKKIHAFMNDLEKKDELMMRTKAQGTTKLNHPPRMSLVMNKVNQPPMVAPSRGKPPVTPEESNEESLEESPAPLEIPRLETTRRVINRLGLKNQDSSGEKPILRANESEATDTPINMLQVVTKPKASEAKNISPKDKKIKLRQANTVNANRIDDERNKLREGLKMSSLPPGNLLDMWPARGPRVHAMRLKNRLCQRNVLLNEGPKYDSKGGTYMPRFKPRLYGTKKVIDFHQTKIPKLVLPRCCNCCRKSVLGCE